MLILVRRIQALEAKVDQLLSSRDGSSEPHSISGIPSRGQSDDGVDTTREGEGSSAALSNSRRKAKESYPRPDKTDTADIRLNGVEDDIMSDALSYEMAELLIASYKRDMMPHFPFVIIHPGESLDDLRRHKPLLFLAILFAASYPDIALQVRLNDAVKHAVSQRMLINGEVSFDLLQGLLVYLAWYLAHHHFHIAHALINYSGAITIHALAATHNSYS